MNLSNIILLVMAIMPQLANSARKLDRSLPELGVSIELNGQVLRSHEIVSIPAALSLGAYEKFFRSSIPREEECGERMEHLRDRLMVTIKNTIETNLGGLLSKKEHLMFQQEVCALEPDICELFHQTASRQKRFIFTAGAALGAGIGAFGYWLYDKIGGDSATTAIAELREHSGKLSKAIKQNDDKIIMVSKSLEKVWSIVLRTSNDLRQFKIDMQCKDTMDEILLRALPILTSVPNQFHRAVNDVLYGKITPDLISYNQLMSMLSEYPPLKDTLYTVDGGLFYQFAHVIPVEIRVEDAMISFIIQVPKISKESIGLLFNINNFGLHNSSFVTRLQLPEYITRFRIDNGDYVYMPVDKTRCDVRPGLWLCSTSSFDYSYDASCVKSLLSRDVKDCRWEARHDNQDPDILISQHSLFIHSDKYPLTLFNISKGLKNSKVYEVNKTQTHWFSLASFDTLVVGHYHLDGKRSISSKIYITSFYPSYVPPLIPAQLPKIESWTDLEEVNKSLDSMKSIVNTHVDTSFEYSSPNLWKSVGYTLLMIFSLFGLGAAILTIKSRHDKRSHNKRSHLAMKLSNLRNNEST